MQLTPFSTKALLNCVRTGDIAKYKVNLGVKLEDICKKTEQAVFSNTLEFTHSELMTSAEKKLVLFQDYGTVLALRVASKALAREYQVKASNRNAIIKGVLETLFDATPSHLFRCDIRSFYESVNLQEIISGISASTRTHPHLKSLIRKLIETKVLDTKQNGIPRGVGLSATFAEIRLKKFDLEIMKIPSVYRYFRYADDILIFSTAKPDNLESTIKTMLGPDLRLNPKKTFPYELKSSPFPTAPDTPAQPTQFDYLGYDFNILSNIKSGECRSLKLSISKSKIAVRKTRVILSLKKFAKDKNSNLLLKRLIAAYFGTTNLFPYPHPQTRALAS